MRCKDEEVSVNCRERSGGRRGVKVFASMGVVCHGVSGMLGSSRGGIVE